MSVLRECVLSPFYSILSKIQAFLSSHTHTLTYTHTTTFTHTDLNYHIHTHTHTLTHSLTHRLILPHSSTQTHTTTHTHTHTPTHTLGLQIPTINRGKLYCMMLIKIIIQQYTIIRKQINKPILLK